MLKPNGLNSGELFSKIKTFEEYGGIGDPNNSINLLREIVPEAKIGNGG